MPRARNIDRSHNLKLGFSLKRCLIDLLRRGLGQRLLLNVAVEPKWAVDAVVRRCLPQFNRTRPRLALVSMWDGQFQEIARITAPTKAAYCASHGYDWRFCTEVLVPGLAPPWTKIAFLLETLPHYDWVMWTDADSAIMNPRHRLEEFILTGADMLITRDLNGFNSGEFMVRRCEWSILFLRDVLSAPQAGGFHRYLAERGTALGTDGFFEQRAILWLLSRYENRRHVRTLPQRVLNSYPKEMSHSDSKGTYRLGDFILHLPGMTLPVRRELLGKYLQESEHLRTRDSRPRRCPP